MFAPNFYFRHFSSLFWLKMYDLVFGKSNAFISIWNLCVKFLSNLVYLSKISFSGFNILLLLPASLLVFFFFLLLLSSFLEGRKTKLFLAKNNIKNDMDGESDIAKTVSYKILTQQWIHFGPLIFVSHQKLWYYGPVLVFEGFHDEDQPTAHFGVKVSQSIEYYRSIELQATTIDIIRYCSL